MNKNQFVYVTYIRTTPEKLWEALTKSEFTQRYWRETKFESAWKKGAPWRAVNPEGTTIVSGEILEIDPPRKLVMSWRSEKSPEQRAEGYARATYELEQEGDSVKLTILHEFDKPDSKVMQAVSNGWPLVLASLKSLLETGEPLEETRQYVSC